MTRPESPVDGPDVVRARERRDEANGRARRAEQAARAVLREQGAIAIRTALGDVHMSAVALATDVNGLRYVDVRLGAATESGETRFRIYNPPALVADPAGDVVLGDRRYRDDPLGALAHTVAAYGGATRVSRKRRR